MKLNLLVIVGVATFLNLSAQRTPVLSQIDLPHSYYFRELYLPQLTSGPSSVTWSPDGKDLVFSMAGSLWRQAIGTETAQQLTDGDGYDYQPDWSPDGKQIIFVRYNGSSNELMLLDIANQNTLALTYNKAVNLEPRWSPDGKQIAFISTNKSGHFLLYKAIINDNKLGEMVCLTPDRKSTVKRYYYSAFDHAINPTWSRDGKEILFVSNREIIHGTGDIVSIKTEGGEPSTIHHEETSWQTRPDMSPDGTRIVYSSYQGRSWHQLWLLPSKGGYPIQLTYGEYDNSAPRWSPDGKQIAFISNRNGNTSIWVLDAFDGAQKKLETTNPKYIRPYRKILILVQDEMGKALPSRISLTDSNGKFYAPKNALIQADDAIFQGQKFETHYFFYDKLFEVNVPEGKLTITASHGPAFEIAKVELDGSANQEPNIVTIKRLMLPQDSVSWWSGDVHVHMNYGGAYKNTPVNLISQARAEDLNFVYNLIVNKEQRIINQSFFSPLPDPASTNEVMLLYGQEFHTSYWGHLGLLGLNDHLILPDYSGYQQTAVQSLFPNNNFITDRAHEQNALVGYVHPFDPSDLHPEQSAALTSELPVEAALRKVDYYEVIGFADFKASAEVWYHLLNCGIRLSAAAGTDAMANYASLRGPVGLNRVYVKGQGPLDQALFQKNLKAGKSFVTNGPMLGFTVENVGPGDSLIINSKSQKLSYSGFVRSAIPVDHVEVIWNGAVVATHSLKGPGKTFDIKGTINTKGPGWLLLRAWSDGAHRDLIDLYAYASTNPVYVTVPGKSVKSKVAGQFFIKWLNRMESLTNANTSFRTEEERKIILGDIRKAKAIYEDCVKNSTIK